MAQVYQLHNRSLASILFNEERTKENHHKQNISEKQIVELYEGLDSALKAALFWQQEELRQGRNRFGGNRCYVTMNIPLLVSSLPFWNISIDGGHPGEPELKGYGFHVSLYPSGNKEKSPQPITSILWQAADLEILTRYLNELFEMFVDEAKLAAKKT